ncbi:MAG TPA: FKBP-type peptidyl-prolyl cis-trans isomerase [Geobacteraceae bacterium]
MRKPFAAILGLFLLPSVCCAEEQLLPWNQQGKDSYSLGYEFGNNLKRQGVEVDAEVLLSAIRDGLEGKNPSLGPEEIRDTLARLKRSMGVLQDQRFKELAAKNLEEGRTFLEANRMKEGVQTLPSGLQYKVLREGNGPVPKATDTVALHYRGRLLNGREFDSSYGQSEPKNIRIGGVIKGWAEALQLMNAGSKWLVFVPSDLAYGPRQFGRIPPNSTLIFELDMLSIIEDTAMAPPLPAETSASD